MTLADSIPWRWRMLGMSAVVLLGMLAFLRIVTNAVALIEIRNRRAQEALARKGKLAVGASPDDASRRGDAVDAVRLAS